MNKSAEKLNKPNVIIEDQNLEAAGFILSNLVNKLYTLLPEFLRR